MCVYVCMYVYVCVCMYVVMVFILNYEYVCMHVCMYEHKFVTLNMYVCMYVCVCMVNNSLFVFGIATRSPTRWALECMARQKWK